MHWVGALDHVRPIQFSLAFHSACLTSVSQAIPRTPQSQRFIALTTILSILRSCQLRRCLCPASHPCRSREASSTEFIHSYIILRSTTRPNITGSCYRSVRVSAVRAHHGAFNHFSHERLYHSQGIDTEALPQHHCL
jgi:hypothetical protein